jgi:glycosyltransferase involved in cell wall biosynthesis
MEEHAELIVKKLLPSPLVSIITPTQNREFFLPLVFSCVQSQNWPSIEWLVEDSSEQPSKFMASLSDPRIHYTHDSTIRPLGEKRNRLIHRAKGEYIVHFDDDDYYAPQYITFMIEKAIAGNFSFVKLSAFFIFNKLDSTYSYWDLQMCFGIHLAWSRGMLRLRHLTEKDNLGPAEIHLGFGFSYAYKRSIWKDNKFPAINWNEDWGFAKETSKRHPTLLFPDRTGLCLHMLHGKNSSSCFPQFLIPPFIVTQFFPSSGIYMKYVKDMDRLST